MTPAATALIADDEPLLREELVDMLRRAWPELRVVALARNGREAIELFESHRPDVCFLDVQMPGLSGIEAAQHMRGRAHLVFVTAYDHYALKAFEHGVLDYLVKPVMAARLLDTVGRLQDSLRGARPSTATDELLQQLARHFERARAGKPWLRWINASVGATLRMIRVQDIDYLRSDEKYTLIAWRDAAGQPGEALLRTPLKELVAQLDPDHFAQIHRSVAVNLRSVAFVTRSANETAEVHLQGRKETLPVSRPYLPLFRQM